MTTRTVLMLLLVVSVTSCATETRVQDGSTPEQAEPITLDGTSWVSGDVSGIDSTGDTEVSVQFDDGRFTAYIACNTMTGPYQVENDRLQVVYESTTETAVGCPQPESSWDRWFLELFTGSPALELDAAALTITNGADSLVLMQQSPSPQLSSTTPTPSGAVDLGGTGWESAVVEGIELPQDTTITLQFTGDRLDVHIDCNDFGGRYEIDDGELHLSGPLETTEMYCETSTALDEWFQDLLGRSPNAQLVSGRLVIANQGDRVVFSPAGQQPTDATETSWTPAENYAFTVALSGGIEPIQDTFRIAVVAGEVADVEPLDRPAHLSDLDVGRSAPNYQDILDHLEYARAAGYEAIDVTLDPQTGRPTSISLDDLRSITYDEYDEPDVRADDSLVDASEGQDLDELIDPVRSYLDRVRWHPSGGATRDRRQARPDHGPVSGTVLINR